MKPKILALAILSLFFAACASNDARPHANGTAVLTPSEQRPHLGMTQAEVVALYGKPMSKLYGPKGEAWRYWFNRTATILIGTRPCVAIIIFDANGRVKDYVWNEN